ncbi:hypothetical protein FHS79_003499 [Polymorphobacter multimanifer]|uniref:Uncharacterized protein n=1 Tax=Polymorphobacter multimanifer TaxID=1070431 RepID=A0A841LJZ8_9SPHN|nr:hypothetical protein [Polymorphobacter multimanifer]
MSEEQPQDGDAAEAFERLRGEVALMRRAVEGMATERATIDAPDYSETLGRMANNITAIAQRVDILAKSPALGMTPEQMTARITAAGSDARRSDQQIIAEASSGLDQATRQLAGVVASARCGDEQNRWLAGAGIGGAIVGMALWVAFAGPIARAVPESWLWPERIAARAVDRPMWDAGQRLMTVANPEAWRGIVAGDQIVRANQDTIERCRKAATKAKKSTRCTIRVGADS